MHENNIFSHFLIFPFIYWGGSPRPHPIGQWRPRPSIYKHERRDYDILVSLCISFPFSFSFLFFFPFLPPFFGRGGGGASPQRPFGSVPESFSIRLKNQTCGEKKTASYHKKAFEFKLWNIRRQWETKIIVLWLQRWYYPSVQLLKIWVKRFNVGVNNVLKNMWMKESPSCSCPLFSFPIFFFAVSQVPFSSLLLFPSSFLIWSAHLLKVAHALYRYHLLKIDDTFF